MRERKYLKKSILLCGESDGKKFPRTFHIVKKISAGASTVCYEAYHERSSIGILKEFYPKDSFTLTRKNSGQLIVSDEFGDVAQRFFRQQQEYLEPYEMLLEAKRSPEGKDLATFFPFFEIYYGCDEDGHMEGTVYIWTPDPGVETFERICQEIHRHPEEKPERSLVTVLTAIESLTRCICSLHENGMLHRDIKPGNFGFDTRDQVPLTQALTMFDVDSICSVYSPQNEVVGTKGYMEPEAGYMTATNQTDIYSIGATLFHAIIVNDIVKEEGYLYQDSYYEQIGEMVDQSALIRCSEANSHPRLRSILTRILKKCLGARKIRYDSCEDLLEDLYTAEFYALPADIARKNQSGLRWVLKDVEKSFDKNREKNSALAIKYHLYEHPLYRYLKKEDSEIRVMILGFGSYGQKFLDLCLQAGQFRSRKLNVFIGSVDRTDCSIYLNERKSLKEFYSVKYTQELFPEKKTESSQKSCFPSEFQEQICEGESNYGNITYYEIMSGNRDSDTLDSEILKHLIAGYYGNDVPHYVFIALGDDRKNRTAAKSMCRIIRENGQSIISYVQEETSEHSDHSSNRDSLSGKMPDRKKRQKSRDCIPLYVNRDSTLASCSPEIERMAYNTHLVWEKNLNIDVRAVKREFRKSYNHEASVSSVLSLKYKLYDIGINLDQCGFSEAAQILVRMKNDGEAFRKIRQELAWVEHRRWVTEKLCLGWSSMDHLEECMEGMTKDEKKKRHVCIRDSIPDCLLWEQFKIEDWDDDEKNLDHLDNLDRMSVELHRMYRKKAMECKKRNLLGSGQMMEIRGQTEGNDKAVRAFQEWYACLKHIWNGDRSAVRRCQSLQNVMLEAVDEAYRVKEMSEQKSRRTGSEKNELFHQQVRTFWKMFYPIYASMEYRDWKQDDVALIDQIPFILTYTEKTTLVIPYTSGRTGSIYDNLAAVLTLNPGKIIYVCDAQSEKEQDKIGEAMARELQFLLRKNVRSAVEIITLHDAGGWLKNCEQWKQELEMKSGMKVRKMQNMRNRNGKFFQYLKNRSKGSNLLAVEKNKTMLSQRWKEEGIYEAFPSYRYDIEQQKFTELNQCDFFGYIIKKVSVTVPELSVLMPNLNIRDSQPEFATDYEDLWNIWKKHGAGKTFSALLGEYFTEHDMVMSFQKTGYADRQAEEYRYMIPSLCRKNVQHVLDVLKKHGVIGRRSCIQSITSESSEVILVDRSGCREKYDQLFAGIHLWNVSGAVQAAWDEDKKEVLIRCDRLTVSGMKIPILHGNSLNSEAERSVSQEGIRASGESLSGGEEDIWDMVRSFQKKGYLIHPVLSENGEISFTCATRQVKEILSNQGRMEEMYLYHKARESGIYDDVACTEELGCVITEGFKIQFPGKPA